MVSDKMDMYSDKIEGGEFKYQDYFWELVDLSKSKIKG